MSGAGIAVQRHMDEGDGPLSPTYGGARCGVAVRRIGSRGTKWCDGSAQHKSAWVTLGASTAHNGFDDKSTVKGCYPNTCVSSY